MGQISMEIIIPPGSLLSGNQQSRPPNADYGVVIVELDEGPRMLSRVEDAEPAEVFIGMRVQAKIVPFEDQNCVVFIPAASENPRKDS